MDVFFLASRSTPFAGGHWDSRYAIHYNGTPNPGIRCGDLGLQQVHLSRQAYYASVSFVDKSNGMETSSQFWRTENYWTTLCCFSLLTAGTHKTVHTSYFCSNLTCSHSCTTVCFFIKFDLNCEELCSLLNVHADR